jgi:hypothetical protein
MSQMSMLSALNHVWSRWKAWVTRSVGFKDEPDPNPSSDSVNNESLVSRDIVEFHLKAPGSKPCHCSRSEHPPVPSYLGSDFHNETPDSPDYSKYLTSVQAREIIQEFEKVVLGPGCQVMWSGVPRTWAQDWADRHGLQTLSATMGPLMDIKNALCRKRMITHAQWSNYVRSASLLFASCLPKGHRITILAMPPPNRFNPTGKPTYQQIEEPVLKGSLGGDPVLKIGIVHFTVVGLEEIRYQVWQLDEVGEWIELSKTWLLLRRHRHLSECTSSWNI